MARWVDINIDEYRAIFGDSDDEDAGDIEGDSSDIDLKVAKKMLRKVMRI